MAARQIAPPGRTFSVNLTGPGAARGTAADEVVSILSRRVRPARRRPARRGGARGPAGSESHQVIPAPATPRGGRPRELEVTLLLPAFPSCTGAAAISHEPSPRSPPSAVIYRKRPMIYGPVISQ